MSDTDKNKDFLDNIAFIMRGIVISFISDKIMENGLGQIQYYNIHIENIDNVKKLVTITITSNIPDEGIYPPIIDYAKEIGYDEFKKILQEKVEKTTNLYKKAKNIQFDYLLDIDIQEFSIELKTTFDLIETKNIELQQIPIVSLSSALSIEP